MSPAEWRRCAAKLDRYADESKDPAKARELARRFRDRARRFELGEPDAYAERDRFYQALGRVLADEYDDGRVIA